nr:CapA family protein [uncultured Romboutsia sp.]
MGRYDEKKKKIRIKNKFKILGLYLSTLVLAFILLFNSFNLFNKKYNSEVVKGEQTLETLANNKTSKVTINAIGDVMAHTPQLNAQHDPKTNTYSFDNNYKYVSNYIKEADLSIANLETTLAGDSIPYSSYPTFNTPDTLADALKNAGVDIVSTINNHSFDKGDLGVERTLDVLKSKQLDTIGTISNVGYKNYLIKEINGISLGITSFSYGEIRENTKFLNGIKVSDKSKDKLNVFDKSDVNNAFNTINNTLKNISHTDIQILIIHWGDEYKRTPNQFQYDLAQKLSDSGVDIIIGSHPHVVQPVEIIKSTDENHETLVIYSLGNFISNQRKELLGTPFTEDGLMVNIEITKNNDKTFVSKVNCIPTWVNKYNGGSKMVYEILPITNKEDFSHLDNITLEKLKNSYNNTASQIKESDIISVINSPFK